MDNLGRSLVAQWVRDPVFPLITAVAWFDLWPRNFCVQQQQQKKNEEVEIDKGWKCTMSQEEIENISIPIINNENESVFKSQQSSEPDSFTGEFY